MNLDRFVDDALALPVRKRARFLRAAARGVAVPAPEPLCPRSRRRSATEPPCRCPTRIPSHPSYPGVDVIIIVPPGTGRRSGGG